MEPFLDPSQSIKQKRTSITNAKKCHIKTDLNWSLSVTISCSNNTRIVVQLGILPEIVGKYIEETNASAAWGGYLFTCNSHHSKQTCMSIDSTMINIRQSNMSLPLQDDPVGGRPAAHWALNLLKACRVHQRCH
jgi:hypothetical protein